MKDMTKGPIIKAIILFGLPLYLGNLLQQLYVVVDSIIVGQCLGTNAVAAVGISMPIFSLLMSIFIGVTIGFSIYIAHLKGSQSYEKYPEAIGSLFIFTFVVAENMFSNRIIFNRRFIPVDECSKRINSTWKKFSSGLILGYRFYIWNGIPGFSTQGVR